MVKLKDWNTDVGAYKDEPIHPCYAGRHCRKRVAALLIYRYAITMEIA